MKSTFDISEFRCKTFDHAPKARVKRGFSFTSFVMGLLLLVMMSCTAQKYGIGRVVSPMQKQGTTQTQVYRVITKEKEQEARAALQAAYSNTKAGGTVFTTNPKITQLRPVFEPTLSPEAEKAARTALAAKMKELDERDAILAQEKKILERGGFGKTNTVARSPIPLTQPEPPVFTVVPKPKPKNHLMTYYVCVGLLVLGYYAWRKGWIKKMLRRHRLNSASENPFRSSWEFFDPVI